MFYFYIFLNLLLSQPVEEYKVNSKYDLFYDIAPYNLNCLNLEDGEIVFYGSNGNVIRTYDNGGAWEQHFSGTHSDIVKMIYHNKNLLAINKDGNFMISEDKGNYWKIYKVSDTLTGITAIDNFIFATSDKNIYYSTNNGLTWDILEFELNKILNISSFGDKIIISGKNFLYYSDDLGSNWTSLSSPINEWEVNDKYKNFYIYNQEEIAKLKNDLTWERYKVNSSNQKFVFTESKNGFFYAFSVLIEYNPKIYIYEYNINEKSSYEVSKIEKIGIDNYWYGVVAYNVEDITLNNDFLYLSNNLKTILKTNISNFNWEIESNYGYPSTNIYIKDTNNWNLPASNRNGILYTTNRGATFEITDTVFQYKTSQGEELKLIPIPGRYIYGEDKSLILYLDQGIDYYTEGFHKSVTIKNKYAFFDEMTKEIQILDVILRGNIFGNDRIYTKYKDKFLIGLEYILKGEPKNGTSLKSDSLFGHDLYFLNKDQTLDTLGNILDSIQFLETFVDIDGNLWAYGFRTILHSSEPSNEIAFYKFNESESKFEFYMTCLGIHRSVELMLNKKGEYIVLNYSNLIKINLETKKYEIVYDDFDRISSNSYQTEIKYIEDKILWNGILVEVDGKMDVKWERLKFDSDLNFEIIEKIDYDEDITYQYSGNKGFEYELLIDYKSTYNKLMKPIEPDRLAYYTSVEKTEKRNDLYTFPPFPQPTKNEVKISTYWDSALPFTVDDVEIYNLAGVEINTTNKLSINKETNYNGHIIWDTSGEQAGVYIVNIKHGTETRTQKVMVEK